MPAEYYYNIMPNRRSAYLPSPTVQHNWYQHTSLGSIPQGDVASQGPFDLRSVQTHHSRSRHNSAIDVFPNSHSQECQHHRFSQPQMYNYQYYTPPYIRRNPVMGGSSLRASPGHSQPPIQEHYDQSQQLPYTRQQQHHPEEQPRNTDSSMKIENSSTNGVKCTQTNQANEGTNSQDYLPPYVRSENSKELATLTERILNNSEFEAVTRRRTNSLQREADHTMKARKRFSSISIASCNTSNTNGAMHATCSAGRLTETNPNHLIPKGKYVSTKAGKAR